MFRLTREVRFAVNGIDDEQLKQPPSNSFGGYPSMIGFGQYLTIQVTLEGKLHPQSGYLRNIKEIDQIVREKFIPRFSGWQKLMELGLPDPGTRRPAYHFLVLSHALLPEKLHSLTINLSPTLSLTQLTSEIGMYTRLSQKFEFSASHRLHNPFLSEDENRKTYGKCTNPNGHGHNYELQVTLKGKPKENGLLVDVPAFEMVVKEYVIDKFDHKHLNLDVPEFKELIPTVENIAMVIHRLLKNRFTGVGAELASVTVWETPKTWCEYSE